MPDTRLRIGSPLPSFGPLRATDGRTVKASDFDGAKALVVVFSCNHCPYVQAYEDRMIQFQKEYLPRGVPLLAINSNETVNYPDDDFDGMVRRAALKKFNFAYLRDESQAAAEAFDATHTPEFFVFGPLAGKEGLRLQYRGKMDDNHKDPAAVKRHYLRDAVDAVLAGKPVTESETPSIGCTIKWKVT
jgi:peroxiredoxin